MESLPQDCPEKLGSELLLVSGPTARTSLSPAWITQACARGGDFQRGGALRGTSGLCGFNSIRCQDPVNDPVSACPCTTASAAFPLCSNVGPCARRILGVQVELCWSSIDLEPHSAQLHQAQRSKLLLCLEACSKSFFTWQIHSCWFGGCPLVLPTLLSRQASTANVGLFGAAFRRFCAALDCS